MSSSFYCRRIIKKGIDVMVIDKEGNSIKYEITDEPKKSKQLKARLDSKNQSKLSEF